jgi:hypothetical protein
MNNFNNDNLEPPGNEISRRRYQRRVATIAAIVIAFIVLISVGIYAGLKVLGSPTSTPSSSGMYDDYSRLRATATAACVTFMDQFPGTPCPPPEDPELPVLATSACFSFIEEFPGTPCPP